MKKVLILSFSPIMTDPRVMRQIHALKDTYSLTVAGFGESPSLPLKFISVSVPPSNLFARAFKAFLLFLGLFDFYYWKIPSVRKALTGINGEKFDVVIANDVNTLPLAFKAANGTPVFFDAHEYSPKEFEDSLFWKIFFSRFYGYLCKKYLPKVSSMTTICESIANEYAKNYGVNSVVMFNSPAEQILEVKKCNLEKIRLIHHGVAINSRKLELMIEMMRFLDDRFTLDLMLMNSNQKYMDELKKLAKDDARIKFIVPVPLEDICYKINNYDIGVFLLPPVNFNYKFALPNKFFEFIQARLAVAIGPSPEMAKILNKYGFGIVASDFLPETLANCLSGLTREQIQSMKVNSDRAAKEINSTAMMSYFLNEIDRLSIA